jgi:hypothetical protein
MKTIITRFLAIGLSLGISSFPVTSAQEISAPSIAKGSQKPTQEDGYRRLFDGKSTDGWEGNLEWFRVEENCIVAGRLDKPIPHNEFLCTQEQYANFELKLEVRLKGKGDNAGVQFRTVRVPNSSEVSGFQCDVGNAFGRPVWGALYDESRRRKMLAEGDKEQVPSWLKKDDWNELTVRADKDRIKIWLNGHLTVDYTETDPAIAKTGIIGLQIHSGPPSEAWYRNIRIKVLP